MKVASTAKRNFDHQCKKTFATKSANSSRHPTATIGTAGLPASANQEAPPHGPAIGSLVSADLLAVRTCQRRDEARVIGWPQTGRRPVGRQVADDFHVVDTGEAA